MLSIKNVSKVYKTKGGVVTKALDNVSIDFPAKGMIFLLGRSGSGKSTLLNVIGGLDKPDSGEVIIKGKSSKSFTGTDFDSYRNTFIGFIFQEYNILNEFNVEQNIGLALQLQGKKADKEKIAKLLEQVDLKGVSKRKPNTLSGGQKQRIAIARALIKEPQIIMADEPTGALDSNTGKQVFDTLKKLSKDKLVIVVSHDREFAKQYGDRIVELKDGKIISDETKELLAAKAKSANYTIGENGVIQIKNGSKLTATDTKHILDEIKKSKGEVIISSSKDNSEDLKKALKIRDDGSSEVFNETKKVDIEKYDGKQTKFIKSRMPLKRAFKMGASSLKHKPVRLFFTILLSSVSFAMFGIVSTFMLYDPIYSFKTAINKMDYKTDSIIKKYDVNNVSIRYNYLEDKADKSSSYANQEKTYFGVSEVAQLNETKSRFAGTYSLNSYYSGSQQNQMNFQDVTTTKATDYFKYKYFDSLCDCGSDFADANFQKLAGDYPNDTGHIAITDYTADLLISAGKASNYEELCDYSHTLKLNGQSSMSETFTSELTISGIYKIDDIPERYQSLKQEASTQDSNERAKLGEDFSKFLTSGLYLTGFVTNDYYNEHIGHFKPVSNQDNNIPSLNIQGVYLTEYEITGEPSYYSNLLDAKVLNGLNYKLKMFDKEGNEIDPSSVGENECVCSKSDDATLKQIPDKINYKDKNGITGSLTVKGYYNSGRYSTNTYFVNPNFTKKYADKNTSAYANIKETKYELPNDAKYSSVALKTNHSDEDIKIMLKQYDTYFYEMGNQTYVAAKNVVQMVSQFKQIFLYVGIGTGALAALLLVNFITVSISNKKKDIGILRAVGARGGDVFKIFYSESGVIAAICFVISTIGAGIACYFLDKAIAGTALGINVISYGIINILITLGASLLITFIATLIPVIIAAKKPPVESIRSL